MRFVHLLFAIATLTASAAAQARVIAVAESPDGARIELHDDAGICVGSARQAEHISKDGEKILGCWIAVQATVTVSFLDGERANIPMVLLRRTTAL